jgi:hypothetical protein
VKRGMGLLIFDLQFTILGWRFWNRFFNHSTAPREGDCDFWQGIGLTRKGGWGKMGFYVFVCC